MATEEEELAPKKVNRYVRFEDTTQNQYQMINRSLENESDRESFSDAAVAQKFKKRSRNPRKRVEFHEIWKRKSSVLHKDVWAYCISNEVDFQLLTSSLQASSDCLDFRIEIYHSEVIFCSVFKEKKTCFIFKYGCLVLWNFTYEERRIVLDWIKCFLLKPLCDDNIEYDDMGYNYSEHGRIKADIIHLNSSDIFEKLAYSYAFAQSVKLSVFEAVVDSTIEANKKYPEGLARTGSIKLKRHEICRKIGELFVNRFFINLQTDILDTPDILWEHDHYADQYESCRRYLEIPSRVTILNQRLDIIKDLFDMLNNELVIQHGYNLEWIVIILICIEVLIDVIWNIILKRFAN